MRPAIRGRDTHQRAPKGLRSEGSVRAVPEGIGADDRSGDWRAHLQTVRKADGRRRCLCILPVAACRGACGGVHLDARLSALRVRVRAVRGFARRAGLRRVLESRVEVRLRHVQSASPHVASVGGAILPWMLRGTLRQ